MDEARLIRFVAGPDGVVAPDLARKLPGRGLWVAADRASVETAAKKNLFSRAAKAKLNGAGRPGRPGRSGCCAGAVWTSWGLRGARAFLSRASRRSRAAIRGRARPRG